MNVVWSVYTSVGVGGRGFLDPLRFDDAFDVKPLSTSVDMWAYLDRDNTELQIWFLNEEDFSPFLPSSTLQPIACLSSCWQHSHIPSTQKQGWYFCIKSLLTRTSAHIYIESTGGFACVGEAFSAVKTWFMGNCTMMHWGLCKSVRILTFF